MIADVALREIVQGRQNLYVAIQISIWELDRMIEELSQFPGESKFLTVLKQTKKRHDEMLLVMEVHEL